MGTISFCVPYLLFALIFSGSCSGDEVADGGNGREALEIIIGGGGGGYSPAPSPDCPPPIPPPPPPCPPPIPPPPPPCPPPPSPPKRTPPPPPKPTPLPPKPTPPPPPTPIFPYFKNELIRKSYMAIQRFKRLIVYDPTGMTRTWKENEGDVCNKYIGFACDSRPDNNKTAVASIDFNGKGLAGRNGQLDISEFLDEMVDLAIFHANSNNFTGKIPKSIGTLKYLYEFDVSNNKYSGEFPLEVLGAKNIIFLDLRFNTFSGKVPPQVFSLTYVALFLNNNNFLQQLPSNLGTTPVQYLTFANNRFTGHIPKTIGNPAFSHSLLEVLFLNNQLTGCLPYQIGNLRNATVFDVSVNQLTGPIPHSFSCLRKMEILNLRKNRFYGTVPEAVCQLPKLSNLSLSHNYFTQVGTACRKLISKKYLDVSMNCILGLPGQRSPAECANFFSYQPKCEEDPRDFNKVPCKGIYADSDQSVDAKSSPVLAPSRSYDALAPHFR